MSLLPTTSGSAGRSEAPARHHVFLWLAGAPEKLAEPALEACKARQNPIYLSVVSAWEIQVKSQLGKLTLDDPLAELVREQQAVNGLRILGVELSHVLELEALPSIHGDTFDRLLIAEFGSGEEELFADVVLHQAPHQGALGQAAAHRRPSPAPIGAA